MREAQVIVAGPEGLSSSVTRLIGALKETWPASPPIKIQRVEIPDLSQTSADDADALILIHDTPDIDPGLRDHFENLEDAAIPVFGVVHQHGEPAARRLETAGVLTCRPAEIERLIAMLQGALLRRRPVRQLRRENSVAQRFHGGLRGQITKIHEEMQLAAMVQREFLPETLPDIPGVDFGVLYRPSNYVSGDIYDVSRLDEDHVGIFLADAVGHGVPAALMTMVICRSLTTHEIVDGQPHLLEPADVMGRLNQQMISRGTDKARFATAVYALVNCRERRMTVAGAGHPPPLLLRGDSPVEELTTEGGLLGVFDHEEYDQITVAMGADDRLIVYSDGFEQAFPSTRTPQSDHRMPTTQYRREFECLRDCPTAEAMIARLQERLDCQSGSLHQVDDLTTVCMHVGDEIGGRQHAETAEPLSATAG